MAKRLMDVEKSISNYDLFLLPGDIKKLLLNLKFYLVDRPDLTKHKIKFIWAKCVYYFYLMVDTPPPMGKKESITAYFDKINPKYGLRYYTCLKARNMNRDLAEEMEYINETFKNKIDKTFLKERILLITEWERIVNENYNKYLLRNKVFNNKSEDS